MSVEVRTADGRIDRFRDTQLRPGRPGRFARWDFEFGDDDSLTIWRITKLGYLNAWSLRYEDVEEIERERGAHYRPPEWVDVRRL